MRNLDGEWMISCGEDSEDAGRILIEDGRVTSTTEADLVGTIIYAEDKATVRLDRDSLNTELMLIAPSGGDGDGANVLSGTRTSWYPDAEPTSEACELIRLRPEEMLNDPEGCEEL